MTEDNGRLMWLQETPSTFSISLSSEGIWEVSEEKSKEVFMRNVKEFTQIVNEMSNRDHLAV